MSRAPRILPELPACDSRASKRMLEPITEPHKRLAQIAAGVFRRWEPSRPTFFARLVSERSARPTKWHLRRSSSATRSAERIHQTPCRNPTHFVASPHASLDFRPAELQHSG